MGKEYNHNPENPDTSKVNEPMLEYGVQEERDVLPSLTEEELKECIKGEEFVEHWCKYIDKLFGK